MVVFRGKPLGEGWGVPRFFFFCVMVYPPRWIADPKGGTAGAAGGCILLRREALERIGGIAAIKGEVIDDCALARAVKRSGGGIWVGLTPTSVRFRRYGSFAANLNKIVPTPLTPPPFSFFFLFA